MSKHTCGECPYFGEIVDEDGYAYCASHPEAEPELYAHKDDKECKSRTSERELLMALDELMEAGKYMLAAVSVGDGKFIAPTVLEDPIRRLAKTMAGIKAIQKAKGNG